MLLALESATSVGSVAVGEAGRVLAEVAVGVSRRPAEVMLPAVDYVLGAAGLTPSDLTGIVVGAGPGSFTGVRIAGAMAKGLVHALSVPLHAFSSLLALAATVQAADRPVCALLDARRDQVFGATYRFPSLGTIEVLAPPAVRSIQEVLENSGAGDVARSTFVGDGALKHRDRIEALGGHVTPAFLAVPRAGALLWLADVDAAAGLVPVPADWEPDYVRAWGRDDTVS